METALFVIVAVLLVGVALAFVLPALWRRADPLGQCVGHTSANAEVSRRQLEELERDVARGLFAVHEAAGERERIKRQLLAEASRAIGPAAPRGRWPAVALAVLLPAIASLLYLHWGTPRALGAHDGLSAELQAQQAADAYVARLEQQVATFPRDGRAWVLLARAHMEKDEFAQASRAYAQALKVSSRVARDPGVLCEAADAIGMEQGGSLAGRPSELVAQALAIDGSHAIALEMAGSAAVEQNRYPDAVRYWSALLEQLPTGSARYQQLAAAIEAAQRRIGPRS
jgi:cytochrome c-type biogenesis protein CcmH